MTALIGKPLRRREDVRFLTGSGRYLDDLAFPGSAVAHVVRSSHPHARIAGIDVTAARNMPGVIAVLTGADVVADGVPPLPCCIRIPLSPGTKQEFPARPILAVDRVRHVGEAVALVVAEDLNRARDAAERVVIAWEPLPSVSDPILALEPGAPQIHDIVPGNLNFVWEAGNRSATDAVFARAARVVRLDLVNNRVLPAPLEPRGAVGSWDPDTGYTLHVSSQGPHWIRSTLIEHVLTDVPPEKVRVVTPDVGGGFGGKLFLTPEYVLVLWAARRTGRTVRWVSERREGFLSDTHGRDNRTTAELAMDETGRFLGLRVRTVANMGAYLSEYAPTIPTGDRMQEGVYAFEEAHVEVRGVFTNTGPVESYRGAGRPEATYMIERLVDLAGRETGLGPVEIRRRNMITPAALPFANRLGHVIDSGDFPRLLELALAEAAAETLEVRKAHSRANGKLRGLGISSYIGICAGAPSIPARVSLESDGRIAIAPGTHSVGQGHETAYAQLFAHTIDIPMEYVLVRQGDTSFAPTGSVTAGSRSITLAGFASIQAGRELLRKASQVAADLLNCDPMGLEWRDGFFRHRTSNRVVSLGEVSAHASRAGCVLHADADYAPSVGSFANGCHICEVEVDPETGAASIVNYVAVDDFGTIVNPLLVEGQVHGGVVQGIAQALHEECRFDAEGRLLSTSFMDYTLPRADQIPMFLTRTVEIPCLTNPLGTKGMGESGAIAAPPAVINAVLDALSPLGIRTIDMPATPDRIWQALRSAQVDLYRL